MIIDVLRFVKGYVSFEAEGGFPERFLNLCAVNGIVLWNVKNDGVKVCACTSCDGYKNLDKPALNSGMTLKAEQTHSLKTSILRHKRRCGLLFGAMAAVVCIAVLSSMIWDVEILAEDGVNAEDFTETLASLGVKPGAFKSKIDILDVQSQLEKLYPELAWVSLNIFGGRAEVEMSVVTPVPETVDMNTPTNVVASKAGKITLIGLRSGTKLVKEGMFVPEGELLISAVTEGNESGEHIRHADGFVMAQTQTSFSSNVLMTQKRNILSDETSFYGLYFFGLEIKPFFDSDDASDSSLNTYFVRGGDAVLPVGVIWQNAARFVKTQVELTESEARCSLLLDAVRQIRKDMAEAEISACECVFGNLSLIHI